MAVNAHVSAYPRAETNFASASDFRLQDVSLLQLLLPPKLPESEIVPGEAYHEALRLELESSDLDVSDVWSLARQEPSDGSSVSMNGTEGHFRPRFKQVRRSINSLTFGIGPSTNIPPSIAVSANTTKQDNKFTPWLQGEGPIATDGPSTEDIPALEPRNPDDSQEVSVNTLLDSIPLSTACVNDVSRSLPVLRSQLQTPNLVAPNQGLENGIQSGVEPFTQARGMEQRSFDEHAKEIYQVVATVTDSNHGVVEEGSPSIPSVDCGTFTGGVGEEPIPPNLVERSIAPTREVEDPELKMALSMTRIPRKNNLTAWPQVSANAGTLGESVTSLGLRVEDVASPSIPGRSVSQNSDKGVRNFEETLHGMLGDLLKPENWRWLEMMACEKESKADPDGISCTQSQAHVLPPEAPAIVSGHNALVDDEDPSLQIAVEEDSPDYQFVPKSYLLRERRYSSTSQEQESQLDQWRDGEQGQPCRETLPERSRGFRVRHETRKKKTEKKKGFQEQVASKSRRQRRKLKASAQGADAELHWPTSRNEPGGRHMNRQTPGAFPEHGLAGPSKSCHNHHSAPISPSRKRGKHPQAHEGQRKRAKYRHAPEPKNRRGLRPSMGLLGDSRSVQAEEQI